ncbi:MAG: hypothetical protein OEX18_04605 [Candidatus Krumholzibacteria bacterium]|nr:hypothetical protein [Candidatus Krumholzibacteria bacterium]MDH4336540.1 hypothetical protein [Candidatus Krumholzibacteria bacterium]MDH5269621.1 hypothetical protein [Candidatus Krumholzibacteria bacterium]MDH5627391.1 hypothetical protein [Candidatus Krumholzibacteria bacterium]
MVAFFSLSTPELSAEWDTRFGSDIVGIPGPGGTVYDYAIDGSTVYAASHFLGRVPLG